MRAVLAQTASIAILAFSVSSMMSVGLAYSIGQIVGPLRDARAVFRGLVANFVLVPATVAILPFYVPLAMAHPSLRALSYVPSSVFEIGLPLLSVLFAPILVGFAVKAVAPRLGAGVLLILGAFVVGHLLSRRDRSAVLGLGTAQRNVAGAMVIASRDFTNPDILVMVTASSLVGFIALFPIAWLLSRREPRLGPPTLSQRASPEPA